MFLGIYYYFLSVLFYINKFICNCKTYCKVTPTILCFLLQSLVFKRILQICEVNYFELLPFNLIIRHRYLYSKILCKL